VMTRVQKKLDGFRIPNYSCRNCRIHGFLAKVTPKRTTTSGVPEEDFLLERGLSHLYATPIEDTRLVENFKNVEDPTFKEHTHFHIKCADENIRIVAFENVWKFGERERKLQSTVNLGIFFGKGAGRHFVCGST
jgi:hypothetical protein